MPDEPFAIAPSAPPLPTEADYEAIHTAVMETERGRWFLAEYARRNRNADTALILAAIDRVEALWRERRPAASPAERVRFDLVEMAKAIAQTRSEIAAMRPEGDHKGSLSEASEELDSIVQATAQATSDILAAAEQMQEIAWTLREHGAAQTVCDALDRRATDIYTACSFQDLTGQRIGKVVEVLRFLEERIRAMIDIWGGPAGDVASAPHLGTVGSQLDQPEIDRIMPVSPAGNGHDAAAVMAFVTAAADRNGDDAVTAELMVSAAARNEGAASTDGDLGVAPAAFIVGATALALDPAPAEPLPEPEPAAETAAEPKAERSDPATLLKRILALIRAPEEPAPPQQHVVVETLSTGPEEIPVEAVAVGAVATIAIAERAASRAAVPQPASMDAPATAEPAAVTTPGTPSVAAAPPPDADDDDPADGILMPLSGPLTVDQAVDRLLGKAPVRLDVAPARTAAPAEPVAMPAPEFAVASAVVADPAPEPPAELALAPDPAPPPAPEPAPEPVQAAIPPEPEPVAPEPTLAAPPPPPVDEPPIVAAAAPARVVAFAPDVPQAPPPPPAAAAPAPVPARPPAPPAPVPQPAAPPRHAALAAFASLSDDDKIALFS